MSTAQKRDKKKFIKSRDMGSYKMKNSYYNSNNISCSNNLKGTFILLITSMIWGASFVSQSAGADLLGVNTFNGIRMLLGALFLLPFCVLSLKKNSKDVKEKAVNKTNIKKQVLTGVVCGILLCGASSVQTYGIKFTTPGKSGFITAMYIIFVPFISFLTGTKISKKTIASAFIAMVGMYMLSIKGGDGGVNKGDVLTLICAVLFAVHIVVIDRYALDINPILFSCIQFSVCGIINILAMFVFETVTIEMIKNAAVPILYSGIFSCGIAYTLQPIGQRYADASAASIVMSMESVFAMLFGAILLPDSIPSLIETLGCIIMFCAIILNQVNLKNLR